LALLNSEQILDIAPFAEEQFSVIGSNARWVMWTAACSFQQRGSQGTFPMRGLGNSEGSRPMSDTFAGIMVSSLPQSDSLKQKALADSQGSGTI
jgi:hypothetical protein